MALQRRLMTESGNCVSIRRASNSEHFDFEGTRWASSGTLQRRCSNGPMRCWRGDPDEAFSAAWRRSWARHSLPRSPTWTRAISPPTSRAAPSIGYLLLWVVVTSNLMAMLVQSLSAKLGIATGKNLPEMIRQEAPRPVTWILWVLAEVVAMATDLAEFLGAAVAIYLLFGIPLLPSALITAVVTFGILALQRFGFRPLEAVITGFVGVIGLCYLIETILGQPHFGLRRPVLAASPLCRYRERAARRRHPRRHRHAARHLSALGPDAGPRHRPDRRPEAAHLSLRAGRYRHRHGHRRDWSMPRC